MKKVEKLFETVKIELSESNIQAIIISLKRMKENLSNTEGHSARTEKDINKLIKKLKKYLS